MKLLEQLKEKAKANLRTIVLPESQDERTLRAADRLLADKIVKVILIGNKEQIESKAKELGLQHLNEAIIVDPHNNPKQKQYAELLYELRKSKGMTPEQAEKLATDPLYLGSLIIKSGDADGEVAGAINTTGDVLRSALQVIKTAPGIKCVSGVFLMEVQDKSYGENGILTMADCAVMPVPTAEEMAHIAVMSAQTTRAIVGIEPRVAMLSFSTKGSGKHECVDKVVEATRIAQEMAPNEKIDGELQADAALVPKVAEQKAKGSEVAGRANVLVFPSLEAANIGYKLVQRLGNATAVGPILQGMAAPVNDLSRGCSADDIYNLVVITANQAIANAQKK